MVKVGLREANMNFSRYVKMARNGEDVLLTSRGKPVAVIKAVAQDLRTEEEKMKYLEDQGILRSAQKGKFPLHKPFELKGKSLSEIAIEGRKDRIT